jgi:hypothetical protein
MKLTDLILQMIHPDPKSRPNLSDLFNNLDLLKSKKKSKVTRTKSIKLDSISSNQRLMIKNDGYRQYFKEFLR